MFERKNFFKNFSCSKKKLNKNIKKAKKFFNELKTDFHNFEIPLLNTYQKNYNYDFTASTIKKFSKYKKIVIIGMGGSILGTKSIYSFFKEKINKEVFFFDNLDNNLFLNFKKIENQKNSCFIIISKSGSTLETLANFLIIFKKTLARNKLIFITENNNSALINIANKHNAEIIEHNQFVGGRYSILSEVGMLPSALMGLKIEKFKNIEKLLKNKKFFSCLIYDVACIYTLNSKGVKNSVFMSYDSKLYDFCYWYQQLVGESLGKKGKGITPIISFGPKDHHSVLQLYLDGPKDKFFTFLDTENKNVNHKILTSSVPGSVSFLKNKTLKNLISAQLKATKNVFASKKIPFRQIKFKKNNEEEFGAITTFFVLETILLARMMKINPFDQPAVEQVKVETKKILLG